MADTESRVNGVLGNFSTSDEVVVIEGPNSIDSPFSQEVDRQKFFDEFIAQLRPRIQNKINEADAEMQQNAGITVTNEIDEAGHVIRIKRDARKRAGSINWTAAYQQRTSTYLQTAITLLEIFGKKDLEEIDGKRDEIRILALAKLNVLLSEMIDHPGLWEDEATSQANFKRFSAEIFDALKDAVELPAELQQVAARVDETPVDETPVDEALIDSKEKEKKLQKFFNYANAWVSMDKKPYTIETIVRCNHKEYTIRSEPYCGLTSEIREEYKNREGKEWYKALDASTKKICDYYAEKIAEGKDYQLPPALRGIIPGVKNAYRTSVLHENEELVHYYHSATLPMGREYQHLSKKENIRLTKLSYAAMRSDNAEEQSDSSKRTFVYTTLVSQWLTDTFSTALRDTENFFKRIRGVPENKEEFIDSAIAGVAKATSEEADVIDFHHTNVCLNAARLIESLDLEGFAIALGKIRKNTEDYQDKDSEEFKQFEQLFAETLDEFMDLEEWNAQNILQKKWDGDKDLFLYRFLTRFAILLHKYDALEHITEDQKIDWVFSCASGQNRTEILSFMIVLEAILKHITNNPSAHLEIEIARELAESGHFAIINGPDNKYGIRSKSFKSIPERLQDHVRALVTSVADTKRAGDKVHKPTEMQDFLEALEDCNKPQKAFRLVNRYAEGKVKVKNTLKSPPAPAVWIQIFTHFLDKQKWDAKDQAVLCAMIQNGTTNRILLNSPEYREVLWYLKTLMTAIDQFKSSEFPDEYKVILDMAQEFINNRPKLLNLLALYREKYCGNPVYNQIIQIKVGEAHKRGSESFGPSSMRIVSENELTDDDQAQCSVFFSRVILNEFELKDSKEELTNDEEADSENDEDECEDEEETAGAQTSVDGVIYAAKRIAINQAGLVRIEAARWLNVYQQTLKAYEATLAPNSLSDLSIKSHVEEDPILRNGYALIEAAKKAGPDPDVTDAVRTATYCLSTKLKSERDADKGKEEEQVEEETQKRVLPLLSTRDEEEARKAAGQFKQVTYQRLAQKNKMPLASIVLIGIGCVVCAAIVATLAATVLLTMGCSLPPLLGFLGVASAFAVTHPSIAIGVGALAAGALSAGMLGDVLTRSPEQKVAGCMNGFFKALDTSQPNARLISSPTLSRVSE